MSSPASIPVHMPACKRHRGPRIKFRSAGGHFRLGEEASFPWEQRSGVWYVLQWHTPRGLRQTGYKATLGDKWSLLAALRKASSKRAQLLGVWTGQWETHLFVLDTKVAIERLERALNWKPAAAS